jgi:hypothetical protein
MKREFFKIERGVPLAKYTRGNKDAEMIKSLKKMESGESMPLPFTLDQKASFRVKLNTLQKEVGELAEKAFTVNEDPKNAGHLRVWAK